MKLVRDDDTWDQSVGTQRSSTGSGNDDASVNPVGTSRSDTSTKSRPSRKSASSSWTPASSSMSKKFSRPSPDASAETPAGSKSLSGGVKPTISFAPSGTEGEDYEGGRMDEAQVGEMTKRKSIMQPHLADLAMDQRIAFQFLPPGHEAVASEHMMGGMSEIKLKIYLMLEEPFATTKSSAAAAVMVLTIVASIVQAVAFSAPANREDPSSGDIAEFIFSGIFSLEVLLRVWSFPFPRLFLYQPANVIDVLSIVPFWLNDVARSHEALGGLRALNIFECFLRLLKLCRYFWGWKLLFHALKQSTHALVIPLFFLFIIVVFGSSVLLSFEKLHEDRSSVGIQTLPDAIHYCVVCVVSIDVGDVYEYLPQSAGGKVVSAILMVFGVMFMAMPIAIVGTCFSQTWFDQDRIILLDKLKTRIAQCGYAADNLQEVFDDVDEDGSGEIEFDEFKKMIDTFHLGLTMAKVRRLFNYFDAERTGAISFEDFVCGLYYDEDHDVFDADNDAEEESEAESDSEDEVDEEEEMDQFPMDQFPVPEEESNDDDPKADKQDRPASPEPPPHVPQPPSPPTPPSPVSPLQPSPPEFRPDDSPENSREMAGADAAGGAGADAAGGGCHSAIALTSMSAVSAGSPGAAAVQNDPTPAAPSSSTSPAVRQSWSTTANPPRDSNRISVQEADLDSGAAVPQARNTVGNGARASLLNPLSIGGRLVTTHGDDQQAGSVPRQRVSGNRLSGQEHGLSRPQVKTAGTLDLSTGPKKRLSDQQGPTKQWNPFGQQKPAGRGNRESMLGQSFGRPVQTKPQSRESRGESMSNSREVSSVSAGHVNSDPPIVVSNDGSKRSIASAESVRSSSPAPDQIPDPANKALLEECAKSQENLGSLLEQILSISVSLAQQSKPVNTLGSSSRGTVTAGQRTTVGQHGAQQTYGQGAAPSFARQGTFGQHQSFARQGTFGQGFGPGGGTFGPQISFKRQATADAKSSQAFRGAPSWKGKQKKKGASRRGSAEKDDGASGMKLLLASTGSARSSICSHEATNPVASTNSARSFTGIPYNADASSSLVPQEANDT